MNDTRTVQLVGGPFDGDLIRIPAGLAFTSYRLPVPVTPSAFDVSAPMVPTSHLSVAEYRYDGRTGAGYPPETGDPGQWEDLVITMRYVA